jgi:hypothetical protein
VHWAAVEAVQRVPAHTLIGQIRDRVAARRGCNIRVVAAAGELTELVFYGLPDQRICALSARRSWSARTRVNRLKQALMAREQRAAVLFPRRHEWFGAAAGVFDTGCGAFVR